MDGNNSLKRVGATLRARQELFDSRSIDSDRWISAEEVNRFKDEVTEVRDTCFTLQDSIFIRNRGLREVCWITRIITQTKPAYLQLLMAR